MNRRGFMTSIGLSAPALAFPFGKAFQGTSVRSRPMKIISVSSTAYSMPIPPFGYTSSERAGTKREWGRLSRITPHRPERVLEYIIVKIVSDSGITGFGEATPDIGFFGETLEEVKSAIDLYFGPKIVGRDPFDREEILRQLDFRGNSCARSAIDLAIHDLMGKVLGVPAYDLIGGLCRQAEKFDVGLALLEQPVRYWDLYGMAQVREAVDTLIEADESAFSINDVMNIIRQEAADVINIKIEKVGGLYNAKKVAALAESAGLQCVIGTAFGLGIIIAAKLHLAASTSIIQDAVEFTEVRLHDNLLASPHNGLLTLPLKDGCFSVPQGPGFGVVFDEQRAKPFISKIVWEGKTASLPPAHRKALQSGKESALGRI